LIEAKLIVKCKTPMFIYMATTFNQLLHLALKANSSCNVSQAWDGNLETLACTYNEG
ncbi:hypothetical protein BgiMline_006603, partial [Biomphalaria glabrata]